uniref:M1-specific T cell receptor beta chain-like n=1 Tax=Pristiophorus japonicus TaxID=55135 RepID=UPI00398F5B4B
MARSETERKARLRISGLRASDQAVYYCADTVGAQYYRQRHNPAPNRQKLIALCRSVTRISIIPQPLAGALSFPRGRKLLLLGAGLTAEMHSYQNDSSYSYMYWYRQRSGPGFQLIVSSISTNNPTAEDSFKERFKAPCRSAFVSQWPNRLSLGAGLTAEMHCYQNDTSENYMYWYRQRSGSGFQLIATSFSISDPTPEDSFKERFEGTRPDLKSCSLKVLSVAPADTAVYYCAAGDHSDSSSYYFGAGTKLTVLEHDIKSPKVVVFDPSPEEIKRRNRATVVCLVTNFYPDNIKIQWLVDGKLKESNDTSIHTDLKSIAGEKNEAYSISSRITFDAKVWIRLRKVECQVEHYQNGSDPVKFFEPLAINSVPCGISKDAKMQSMTTAKLTYLILICKSIFYGAFVSILAWKAKASYSKRFD